MNKFTSKKKNKMIALQYKRSLVKVAEGHKYCKGPNKGQTPYQHYTQWEPILFKHFLCTTFKKSPNIFWRNCILLPKLFWSTVRKILSSDWEKTFEIRGWRLRICKKFGISRTIYLNSERSEQFSEAECFFSLFLGVPQIW